MLFQQYYMHRNKGFICILVIKFQNHIDISFSKYQYSYRYKFDTFTLQRKETIMDPVLAVQIPAPCPLSCSWCRTPKHDEEGNADAVLVAVAHFIDVHSEVYLTSTGETGLSPIFGKVVKLAQDKKKAVSVLCATKESVVPGLKRVEVSLNEYTRPAALRAIEKARSLHIPIVLSLVDHGQEINPEALANEYGADGVIIRAQQAEGRSSITVGRSGSWQRPGSDLGAFPVAAYRELREEVNGHTCTCINEFGDTVPILGGRLND
jgi:hypothetical protein